MIKRVKISIKKFPLILVLVFLAALILRLVLINWTLSYGNTLDFVTYEDWTRVAHVHNFAATYTTATHHSSYSTSINNQAPGLIYILSGAYELWITTGKVIAHLTHTAPGSITAVNTYLQHIFMKFPSMLTDLGMGLIAYLLVAAKAGRKRGLWAAALVLFNPVIFYNSAVWGQTDSLNNFFFILSLLFAFRKNTIFSILAFAISLYIKLSLLPLLPFYLIFLFFISQKNLKKILAGIFFSAIAIILATFPISTNPVAWLLQEFPIIAWGGLGLQNITFAAFNFWWVIFCFPTVGHNSIPAITNLFFGLNLKTWAYALFAVFSLPFLYFQIKKPKEFFSEHTIFLLLSIVALLTYIFLPNMHDRYMYPVFPLLAIAVALNKNFKKYLIIFCVLALLHLINLVYSWYPVVLNSKSTFYHIFYGDYFCWIISVLTVIVAGWFYLQSFRELKKT